MFYLGFQAIMVASVRPGRRGALLTGSPFAAKRIYTLSPSHVLRNPLGGLGDYQPSRIAELGELPKGMP